MSGIIGSSHNIRGSGLVAKLGTDGQVFTSAGAGVKQTFEDAAGGGAWNLIKTLTSDGSDTDLQFVDGTSGVTLDSTYKLYVVHFNGMHPETDDKDLLVNFSSDGGSNYNVTKTSTAFRAYHIETDAGGGYGLSYNNAIDLAQVTTGQSVSYSVGADADQSSSGYVYLFNPADTTYVKNYFSRSAHYHAGDYAVGQYIDGFANTTSAIDGIQFTFVSGEIQAGSVSLYGIST